MCLTHHCISYGMAGSEIRANRAPITCLHGLQPTPKPRRRFISETRRYSADGSGGSLRDLLDETDGTTDKEASEDSKEQQQLEQNRKYVKGLIETLESLLDKWIVSGSMATVREISA